LLGYGPGLASGELAYWAAYAQTVEPIGDDWFKTAWLCATVANFNAWGLKKPLQAEDFFPLRQLKTATPDVTKLHNAFLAAMRRYMPKESKPDAPK